MDIGDFWGECLLRLQPRGGDPAHGPKFDSGCIFWRAVITSIQAREGAGTPHETARTGLAPQRFIATSASSSPSRRKSRRKSHDRNHHHQTLYVDTLHINYPTLPTRLLCLPLPRPASSSSINSPLLPSAVVST